MVLLGSCLLAANVITTLNANAPAPAPAPAPAAAAVSHSGQVVGLVFSLRSGSL